MKNFPNWAKGSLFAASLVVIIFFLKITCPVSVGCFADPFVVILFYPSLSLESFFGISTQSLPPVAEPLFIFSFWVFVGFLAGLFFPKKKQTSELGD